MQRVTERKQLRSRARCGKGRFRIFNRHVCKKERPKKAVQFTVVLTTAIPGERSVPNRSSDRAQDPASVAPRELLALDGDAGASEGPGTSVDGLASLRHWPLTLQSRAEREGSGRRKQRE